MIKMNFKNYVSLVCHLLIVFNWHLYLFLDFFTCCTITCLLAIPLIFVINNWYEACLFISICITCISLSTSGIRSGAHIFRGRNFFFKGEKMFCNGGEVFLNVHKILNDFYKRCDKCTFRFGWFFIYFRLIMFILYFFCLSLIYDSHIEGEFFKNPYVWLRGSVL